MRKYIRITLTLATVAMTLLAATSQLTAQDFVIGTEAEHLATIQDADSSYFDKIMACKRLSVLGTEKSVPVLAALLGDEKMAHYARFGLEPIPSKKVDAALRDALADLDGDLLAGVINSIGVRKDEAAVELLIPMLKSDDPAVVSATAFTLGTVATPEAVIALTEAIKNPTAASERSGQAGLADGCLKCAETMASKGDLEGAGAFYDRIRLSKSTPKHIALAAFYQKLVLEGPNALDQLNTTLVLGDDQYFGVGLRASRELKQVPEIDALLLSLVKTHDMSDDRKTLLIAALGDRGAVKTLPTIIELATTGPDAIRMASLRAIAKLGDASSVEPLFAIALDDNESVAGQAIETLVSLKGDGVDAAIVAQLNQTDPAMLSVTAELCGRRRVSAAVPVLLEMLQSDDSAKQLTAMAALGETITLDQLDVLTDLLPNASGDMLLAAQKSVNAACLRMPDRAACATKLAECFADTQGDTRLFLMRQLSEISGPKALEIVAEAANGNDPELQDYATQVLGGWLDTTAAPVLLELAKSEGSSKYGIRAARGYIRLARQFSMSDNARLDICQNALKIATRDDEKVLVLEVLERYPSRAMLALAKEQLTDPALKTRAQQAVRAIQSKLPVKK